MTTTIERPPADAPASPPGGSGAPPSRGRRGIAGALVRWRLALRIAARTAWRNRLATGIAVGLVALPVAGATFLLGLVASSGYDPQHHFDEMYGPVAQAALSDAGCSGCALPEFPAGHPDSAEEAAIAEGIGAPTTESLAALLPNNQVVPWERGSFPVVLDGVNRGMWQVAALPVEWLGDVYSARTGRLPATDREAALYHLDAERLGIALGDAVTIEGTDLVVTGIIDSRNRWVPSLITVSGALSFADSAFEQQNEWLVFGAPVTYEEWSTLQGVGVFAQSRYLTDHPPPGWDVGGGGGINVGGLGLAAGVGAIALIEAVLLVGPAFAVSAQRQSRQLALVAASGGSKRDLRRVVLASGVIIGLVAGVLGAAVGIAAQGVAWFIARQGWGAWRSFTVPVWQILGVVAVAVVLGLVASLVPARAVARLDVTAALAGRRAEAQTRRRASWIGLALLALGLSASIIGALTGQLAALVGGIVALEIGVVMTTGGLLALVARLAPRLGVAGRFALRDALRQRSRTVPAIASIIAAVAAVVAGAVFVATEDRVQEAAWIEGPGVGTIAVSGEYPLRGDALQEALEARIATIATEVPLAGWASVYLLGGDYDFSGFVSVEKAPQAQCPLDDDATAQEWEAASQEDWRCSRESVAAPSQYGSGMGVMVDDGTAVALFIGSDAAAAAAALASGEALVSSPNYLWPDGTVRVSVWPDESREALVELAVPARLVAISEGSAILPASVVAEHGGLPVELAGAVAQPAVEYSPEWADAISGWQDGTRVSVKSPHQSSLGLVLLALVGVAGVIALAATWLSVALAGAETRPDLATMSAVGAAPATTRRVAAAQAAVVAGIGSVAGALLGVALGWALASWSVAGSYSAVWLRTAGLAVPGPVVPWPWVVAIAVVLPLIATAGAWLTAPRRLPLARRVAQ